MAKYRRKGDKGSQLKPAPGLSVRTYHARLAWLLSPVCWKDGRPVYLLEGDQREEDQREYLVPTSGALARAEYFLQKLAAGVRCDDSVNNRALLAAYRAALRVAKRFFAFDTASSIPALAEALVPEALAVNWRRPSPAAMLLQAAHREQNRPALRAALLPLANDPDLRVARVQALLGLLLGAVDRLEEEAGLFSARAIVPEYPAAALAYRWARQNPLPSPEWLPPVLLARLLAEEGGPLVSRCCAAWQSLPAGAPQASDLTLSPEQAWRLLEAGHPAETVAELVEELAYCAPALAERFLHRCHQEDILPAKQQDGERREWAETLRGVRQNTLSAFADLRWKLMLDAPQPLALVRGLHAFAFRALEQRYPARTLQGVLVDTLAKVSETVSPALREAVFAILAAADFPLWREARPLLPSRYRKETTGEWHARWERMQEEWRERQMVRVLVPTLCLLQDTGDPGLVLKALDSGLLKVFARLCRNESLPEGPETGALLRYCFSVVERLELHQAEDLAGAVHLFEFARKHYTNSRAARADLEPLVRILEPCRLAARNLLVEECLYALTSFQEETAAGADFGLMLTYLPQIAALADAGTENWPVGSMLQALLRLLHSRPTDGAGFVAALLALPVESEEWKDARFQGSLYRLEDWALLAAELSGGDHNSFTALLKTACCCSEYISSDLVTACLEVFRRYPALCPPIADRFPVESHRGLQILRGLGRLWQRLAGSKLAPETMEENPLTAWESALSPADAPGHGQTLSPEWQPVLDAGLPGAAERISQYWHACWLCGEVAEVPRSLREDLALPERLRREYEYLEARIARGEGTASLVARRDNLRQQLSDSDGLKRRAVAQAGERLLSLTLAAQWDAIEQTLQEGLRAELRALIGPGVSLPLYLDPDLINAIELAENLTYNRPLLCRLLRACLRGEAREWCGRQEANRRWHREMIQRRVDVEHWLGEHPENLRLPDGGWLRLYLETDPLHVLQMGNPFGTCLGADSINGFSTVTNACDQNKRVLYLVQPSSGRILGRKLLAISDQGKLLGYRLYLVPEYARDETRRTYLNQTVEAWIRAFAGRCNLPLANSGTVPCLIGEHWYDDGAVAWEQVATLVEILP